ncbi:phage antirepressor KilAC domain-containing protein [Brachybacterium alimentarium]|uniref:phage antirepressor KilAC domain-containing protein n=1 Tax=Brachybacterium alimentarium TaxID=47845 RepID=UPI003FD231AC
MNDLIPISQSDDGTIAVSGRALHVGLEVSTRYNDWFARMIAYGFTEGEDYVLNSEYVPGANGRQYEQIDHALTLDAAKEIAMIQRTERGQQVRRYFIAAEKQLRGVQQIPRTYAEALRAAADAEEARIAAERQIEADAPKVLFADAVSTSDSTILVGDLAKILRGNGVDIGATRLFALLRETGYLIARKGSDWNSPTQKAMDLGLFRIKETAVTHSDGHVTVNKTPKVTGKGQTYFVDRFLSGRLESAA